MKKKETEFMNLPVETQEDIETVESADTAPSPIEITTPVVFTIEQAREIEKHAKKIANELFKAEKAFTQIACELAWLYESDRYKAIDTAMTFEKFCESRYGFKKTQAYALVSLVERFGYCDSATGEYAILDQWKGYGQTKLINMIPLTDVQIAENINPKMTVAEIKKIVKNFTKGVPLGLEDFNSDIIDADVISETDADTDCTAQTDTDTGADVEETRTQLLASFTSFTEFEDESPTFFKAISDVFKANQNCKVFISYEC